MNPSGNERTGLNLPPPVGEQAPAVETGAEAPKMVPETAPLATEADPTKVQPQAPAMPTIPLPTATPMPQNTTTDDVANTTPTNAPAVADDGDLIEKEWVNKAKQIVERTRDDPHQQSQELTVFKADYMKKRYNKSLKLGE